MNTLKAYLGAILSCIFFFLGSDVYMPLKDTAVELDPTSREWFDTVVDSTVEVQQAHWAMQSERWVWRNLIPKDVVTLLVAAGVAKGTLLVPQPELAREMRRTIWQTDTFEGSYHVHVPSERMEKELRTATSAGEGKMFVAYRESEPVEGSVIYELMLLEEKRGSLNAVVRFYNGTDENINLSLQGTCCVESGEDHKVVAEGTLENALRPTFIPAYQSTQITITFGKGTFLPGQDLSGPSGIGLDYDFEPGRRMSDIEVYGKLLEPMLSHALSHA